MERQWGSSKYASFALLSSMFAVLIQILMLAAVGKSLLPRIPSGPYGFIFASMVGEIRTCCVDVFNQV